MIALRLLWREFVSGQLSLLALALVVSVAATTTEVLTTVSIVRCDRCCDAPWWRFKLRGPRPIDLNG